MPKKYASRRRYAGSKRRRARKQRFNPANELAKLATPLSIGQMARAAWQGVKYIKGLVNSEKYTVQATNTVTVTSTPSVINMTAVATGDGEGQRTGNSIFVRNWYLKCLITRNASVTADNLRVVVVLDTQNVSDSAPSYGDVFGNNGIINGLEVTTKGRFQILYDNTFQLNAQDIQHTINSYHTVAFHTRYNGTNTTDIQKNGLYLMLAGQEATNGPSVTYLTRIYYHDN